MSLRWNDKLSVGNSDIDAQHMVLMLIARYISDAIKKGNLGAMEKLFTFLEVQLKSHFLTEERLAKTANYEFSEHKHAQHYLMNEILSLRNKLFGKKVWSDDYAKYYCYFLENRLINNHIIKTDMKMKPALLAWPP